MCVIRYLLFSILCSFYGGENHDCLSFIFLLGSFCVLDNPEKHKLKFYGRSTFFRESVVFFVSRKSACVCIHMWYETLFSVYNTFRLCVVFNAIFFWFLFWLSFPYKYRQR